MRQLGTQNRLDRMADAEWRYECTECGSFDVRPVREHTRRHDKSYVVDGSGRQKAAEDAKRDWRCENCNERLISVYDKKRSEERRITTIL